MPHPTAPPRASQPAHSSSGLRGLCCRPSSSGLPAPIPSPAISIGAARIFGPHGCVISFPDAAVPSSGLPTAVLRLSWFPAAFHSFVWGEVLCNVVCGDVVVVCGDPFCVSCVSCICWGEEDSISGVPSGRTAPPRVPRGKGMTLCRCLRRARRGRRKKR